MSREHCLYYFIDLAVLSEAIQNFVTMNYKLKTRYNCVSLTRSAVSSLRCSRPMVKITIQRVHCSTQLVLVHILRYSITRVQ